MPAAPDTRVVPGAPPTTYWADAATAEPYSEPEGGGVRVWSSSPTGVTRSSRDVTVRRRVGRAAGAHGRRRSQERKLGMEVSSYESGDTWVVGLAYHTLAARPSGAGSYTARTRVASVAAGAGCRSRRRRARTPRHLPGGC